MSLIIILSVVVAIIFVSVIVAAIVLKMKVVKADDENSTPHKSVPPVVKTASILAVSLVLLAVVAVKYFEWDTGSTVTAQIASNDTQAGERRVNLTTKEEQMLQQYCTDMHNSYGLSFDKAYAIDYPDASSIINVEFLDAGYQGKIIHDADGGWTGKLERLIYNE